jgi:Protein of unknown function (DUF742)
VLAERWGWSWRYLTWRAGHACLARLVSPHLHLPLGVVRVLVGDMADEQLVVVHRPAHAGDRPDLALLERVLDGLRTI